MLDLMSNREMILLAVFFVTSMMSIGMQTRGSDLSSLAASRGYLGRALLINFVVLPIVGLVIASLFPLQPHVAGAIIFLACTPGGLSAIQFTSKISGSSQLAAAMLFLLSVLAVFISPWILRLALPGDVRLVIPMGRALVAVLVYLFLPLLAGMLLLNKLPGVATRLAKLFALVGLVAFVTFMVVSGDARQAAAGEIGMVAVSAMFLFIFVSMVIGWYMGGPTHHQRQVMATSTSMRNAALCLAIVEATDPGHAVVVPLVAFSFLMVTPNMLFTIYNAVQAKRKAKAESAA